LAGKVTEGLTESNGVLPLGGWLKVSCGLTAGTLGSAAGPTLGNEYGRTLPLYYFYGCMFSFVTAHVLREDV